MASDFVRNIKGVRNINKLSRNITTENDLISTTDGEVYVVTKKGYKNITNVETQDFEKLKTKVENLNNQSDTNTTDIATLQTDVSQLLSDTSNHKKDINTLKEKTDNNKSLIEAIDLTGYAKKEDIPDEVDLSGYAKKEDIPDEVDLSGYAKKEDIPDEVDLSGYAKKEDVPTNYNKKITSTGWLPITIKNGYKKSTIPDFEPSYRVIDYGTYKKLYVRLGVTNLTNGKNTVASIPTELNTYKIYSLGVSTIAKIPPKVVVSGGNIEIHPNSSDSYIDTDYVIYQGSWIINKEDE